MREQRLHPSRKKHVPVFLGIDIGTSRVKAAAINKNGRLLFAKAMPTPDTLYDVGSDIRSFYENYVAKIVNACRSDVGDPAAICISAVAPSLVAFCSRGGAQLALCHLTPAKSTLTLSDDLQSRLALRRKRTHERLKAYRSLSGHEPLFYLPLSSALVYLLTGNLVLDPINSYELGYGSVKQLGKLCNLKMAPSKTASVLGKAPHFKGQAIATTDTCASIVGAGITTPSTGMIYYGTYYSCLELNISILSAITDEKVDCIPYYWHISLPRYGSFVETFLKILNPNTLLPQIFRRFEKALQSRPQQLQNVEEIITVPKLPTVVTSDTPVSITLQNLSLNMSFQDIARSIASPLGNALQQMVLDGRLSHINRWHAAGGGATNIALVKLTSELAGIKQVIPPNVGTAFGTAKIAHLSSTAAAID